MYSNKQCTVKPIWPERCQPWGVSKWDKGESFVVFFVQNRKMLVMMTTQIIVFKERWHARGAILSPWQSLGGEYKEGGKDISRFTGSSKMTPMLLKGLTSVWYSILWKVATFQLIDPISKNRGTSAIEHTSSVVESKLGAGVLSFCQAVWKIENCQAIWSMKIESKIVAQLEIGAKWCFDQFEIPRINIFLLLLVISFKFRVVLK